MRISPIVCCGHSASAMYRKTNNSVFMHSCPYDTVSFGSIKKNTLTGFDYSCAELFKAPLEQFNSKSDFDSWAQAKYEEQANKKYLYYNNEITAGRHNIIADWKNYFASGNAEITPAMKLIAINGITKDLEANRYEYPMELDKGALADTFEEIKHIISKDKKAGFNFKKIYEKNLKNNIIIETKAQDNVTAAKWLHITSKENDPENYIQNLSKLRALSHKGWCTKSYFSDIYLEKGDFYVLVEGNNSKAVLRMEGDVIVEIEGEKNNQSVPLKYAKEVDDFIKEQSFVCKSEIANNLARVLDERKRFDAVLSYLSANNGKIENVSEFYDAAGIEYSVNDDGTYTLANYIPLSKDCTYSDLGIDENKLLENVSFIEGNADFSRSGLTELTKLQRIAGNANFSESKISDLGALEYIDGFANFSFCRELKSLCKLKETGDLSVSFSSVEDFSKLEAVNGGLDASCAHKLKSLGNLAVIDKDCDLCETPLDYLDPVEYIGGGLNIAFTNICDAGWLDVVEGNIMCCPEGDDEKFDHESFQHVCRGEVFFTNEAKCWNKYKKAIYY